MDISRAKTILIVSFLILNIFLGFRLWQRPQYMHLSGGLTANEMELAKTTLSEAGYQVLASIPNQVPRLSLLHVARPATDEAAWINKFWGEDKKTGNENLEILANGLVVFSKQSDEKVNTKEGKRQLVELFLCERGVCEDDLQFDMSFPLGNGYELFTYVQTYEGFPLFTSFVQVKIGQEGVAEVRINRVIPLEFADKEIQGVSALVAVNTLVQQPGDFINKTIVDISLGYYSKDYDAKRWEIVPAWRFAASDGSVFYVNALNGEVEEIM